MTLARRAGAAAAAATAAAVLSACPERTGPATVTVLLGGTPLPGVEVLFHDRHGSLRSRVLTGPDGAATAVVAEGASATVARLVPGTAPDYFYYLETVAGLNPGDAVVAGTSTPGPVATGQVDVTLPGAFAGATSYRVEMGCSYVTVPTAGGPVSLQVLLPCGSTVSAVAVAIADGGSELAFTTATDVLLSGTAPALTGSITLPAWRTDFGSLALTASSVPASGSLLYATLRPRRNGVLFYGSAAAAAVAPGGSASLALPFVQGLGTSARLYARVNYETGGINDGIGVVQVNDLDPSTPRSLDLAAALPPRLSTPSVSATGGALTASWASAGSDPSLDVQFLHVSWSEPTPFYTLQYLWDVTLPPGVTFFTFPRIPDELGTWLPPPGTVVSPRIEAFDVSTVTGYAAFKATYDTSFSWEPPEAGSYILRSSSGY